MPYLDASVVKDTYIFKKRGYLGIVYFNRTAKEYYFAVMKLTNNAVKQLVVNMEIPYDKEKEHTKIRIETLDEKRIGVFLINKHGETQYVFSINEKGPIMYVRSLWDKIYINDDIFELKYTQESYV